MTLFSQFAVLVTGSDLTLELKHLRLKIFFLVALILSLLLVSSGYNIYYETRQKVIQERNQTRVLILEERKSNPNPVKVGTRPLPPNLEDTEEALIRLRWVIFINNLVLLSGLLILTWLSLYYFLSPVAKAQIERDKFLAKASHELRTPLAILHSEMSLAVIETDTQELQLVLKDSLVEITRLQKLSDRLLNKLDHRFSEVQSFTQTEIAVKEFINGVIHHLSALNQNNLIFNVEITSDVVIVANQDLFHQLIFNLLDNLVRYAKANTIATITWEKDNSVLRIINLTELNEFLVGTGLEICNELSQSLGLLLQYDLQDNTFSVHLQHFTLR